MLKNLITVAKITRADIFCSSSNNFALYDSLRECRDKGFEPVFLPETIDFMIHAKDDTMLYRRNIGWITPSIKIGGKSKQGNRVVVYAHVPTFFTTVENFQEPVRDKFYKTFLERETPQGEFEKILELEGNERVFVHDYSEKREKQKNFEPQEAMEKTRLNSILGGRKRAEAFFQRFEGRVGEIEINDSDFHLQCSSTRPAYGNTRLIEFNPRRVSSWNDFSHAYFLGVREEYPTLNKALLNFDSLFEQVSALSDSYVPEVAKKKFSDELKNLILE